MRKNIEVLMVALIATAFAAGTTTANTIIAVPSGFISATSLNKLTFSGRGGINIEIECRVTLRGFFDEAIRNARSEEIASIFEGFVNECSGSNTMRMLVVAPWFWVLNEATRLSEANTGLATLNIRNAQFQVTIAGVNCLYAGTVSTSLLYSGSPLVTRLILVLANEERRSSGSFLCPERGELRGTFEITRQTLRL